MIQMERIDGWVLSLILHPTVLESESVVVEGDEVVWQYQFHEDGVVVVHWLLNCLPLLPFLSTMRRHWLLLLLLRMESGSQDWLGSPRARSH
jgi:hypothetical protein